MNNAGFDQSFKPVLTEKQKSRRDFLGWIINSGLVTTFMGMLMPALTYLWPVTRRGPASGMIEVGSTDEIPIWGSKKVAIGGSPVIVFRTPQEFKAYSAICTHLGCIVSWNDAQHKIECPCHAGFFDIDGRVASGPPPKPLSSYAVNVTGDKIFIKL